MEPVAEGATARVAVGIGRWGEHPPFANQVALTLVREKCRRPVGVDETAERARAGGDERHRVTLRCPNGALLIRRWKRTHRAARVNDAGLRGHSSMDVLWRVLQPAKGLLGLRSRSRPLESDRERKLERPKARQHGHECCSHGQNPIGLAPGPERSDQPRNQHDPTADSRHDRGRHHKGLPRCDERRAQGFRCPRRPPLQPAAPRASNRGGARSAPGEVPRSLARPGDRTCGALESAERRCLTAAAAPDEQRCVEYFSGWITGARRSMATHVANVDLPGPRGQLPPSR